MPKLITLETSDSISAYTPADGRVSIFYALENNRVVIKAKQSNSEIVTVSGGIESRTIAKWPITRPDFDAATHLVLEADTNPDFSAFTTVIDTANVSSDRTKVLGFTGLVFVPCPSTGFGGNFSGQTVLIDLASILEPSYIRYKWVASAGDGDWIATFFSGAGA